jgi:uncharacterized membrane protein
MRDELKGPRFMRGFFYAVMLSAIFWLLVLLISVVAVIYSQHESFLIFGSSNRFGAVVA